MKSHVEYMGTFHKPTYETYLEIVKVNWSKAFLDYTMKTLCGGMW